MDQMVQEKLDSFFSQFNSRTYKMGEMLIRADENPSGIFYLKEGSVREYALSKEGEELVVNIFKPGAFFPMNWGINGTKNHYFFEAMSPLELWHAPREKVTEFLRKNPDVMYDLLSRLYRGTDGLLIRLLYVMSGSAYTRLITELLISAKRFGTIDKKNGSVTCILSETELATHAGIARETVSREMQRLKKKKLVLVSRNQIVIPDMIKLEEELSEDF